MTAEQGSVKDVALASAHTAAAAFADQAAYFRNLPPDAWNGPTGCEKWTMHDLAGHAVGEAVWFAHLVLEVTQGVPPLPDALWGQLKDLQGQEIADRMDGAARDLPANVEAATPEQLQRDANLGFATIPLWQALGIGMLEGVVHNWDGRARREADARIPTEWALALVPLLPLLTPIVGRIDAAQGAPGYYLLQVGDGVGPITAVASESGVTLVSDREGEPDVTLHLTADQYVRLVLGRLPLDGAIASGRVAVEGDSSRAQALNRIFAGVAN